MDFFQPREAYERNRARHRTVLIEGKCTRMPYHRANCYQKRNDDQKIYFFNPPSYRSISHPAPSRAGINNWMDRQPREAYERNQARLLPDAYYAPQQHRVYDQDYRTFDQTFLEEKNRTRMQYHRGSDHGKYWKTSFLAFHFEMEHRQIDKTRLITTTSSQHNKAPVPNHQVGSVGPQSIASRQNIHNSVISNIPLPGPPGIRAPGAYGQNSVGELNDGWSLIDNAHYLSLQNHPLAHFGFPQQIFGSQPQSFGASLTFLNQTMQGRFGQPGYSQPDSPLSARLPSVPHSQRGSPRPQQSFSDDSISKRSPKRQSSLQPSINHSDKTSLSPPTLSSPPITALQLSEFFAGIHEKDLSKDKLIEELNAKADRSKKAAENFEKELEVARSSLRTTNEKLEARKVEVEKLKIAQNQLQEKTSIEVKNLEAKLVDATKAIEAEKIKSNKQLEDSEAKREAEVSDVKAKAEWATKNEVNRINSENAKIVEKLKSDHNNMITTIERKNKKENADLIKKVNEKHSEDTRKLEEKNMQEMNKIKLSQKEQKTIWKTKEEELHQKIFDLNEEKKQLVLKMNNIGEVIIVMAGSLKTNPEGTVEESENLATGSGDAQSSSSAESSSTAHSGQASTTQRSSRKRKSEVEALQD